MNIHVLLFSWNQIIKRQKENRLGLEECFTCHSWMSASRQIILIYETQKTSHFGILLDFL